tara:strand:- start:2047 stop:3264 length:1218 start_codon:yes stop_codon:yes gene_type:complete
MKSQSFKTIIVLLVIAGALGAFFFVYANTNDRAILNYSQNSQGAATTTKEVFVPTHIDTPENVRAIYMTSWVAGTTDFRQDLVDLVEETELNSIIIDIKDYSGKIAFPIEGPLIEEYGMIENRVPDIKEFIEELHKKGIYVIGRVTVFQDPYLAQLRPDLAVQKASDKSVWKDRKGLSFTDPGNKEVWDYHIAIAEGSYNLGFDEINFDYIRFPSDGDMTDIYYPKSEEVILADPDFGKAEVVEGFFRYLDRNLDDRIVTSADIFGMTTTNYDDLNIGQVLERALPHFDYIAPMVYPSHYPKNFIGLSNPAAHPYEVIKYSMDRAHERTLLASTTPAQLRPWYQDFDLGADYTAELVRAQITAGYDAGVDSWMLWAPSNRYTKGALKPYYVEPVKERETGTTTTP